MAKSTKDSNPEKMVKEVTAVKADKPKEKARKSKDVKSSSPAVSTKAKTAKPRAEKMQQCLKHFERILHLL